MMHRLLALALIGFAVAAPAAPGKPQRKTTPADWSKVAALTPAGSVRIGNPAAKVKIVEYLSFTCPHCAAFARESAATLKGQMVKSGKASLEFRPLTSNQLDLTAAIIARCTGPARYAATVEAIFAHQDEWSPLGVNFVNRELRRFAAEKPLEQIRIMAQSIGLNDIAKAQGLSDAQIKACFADPQIVNPVLKIGAAGAKIIEYTPTFYVGGRDAKVYDWASLEPILRAQGAQ
ncbi:thioredoxin domain-containing protein [Sphingomonas aquatica]|uniref:thioredoxin domain-containing protein n=2 Tax=Sphingomonas TaxID=13687 RepID=UPI00082E0552